MRIELYNRDCLNVLSDYNDKSIDMTFTSPPFKEKDVDGDYWPLYDKWFNEIMRVTSKVVCIIHSATKLNYLISHYPPKRTMIWGKGISCYPWRWNPILVYQISDEYKVHKFIWSDALGIESVTGKWKVHAYQDPELLYETVIKMFKGCDTVLDPFMGSGTSGRVCKKLKKNFIGIELDTNNYNIAKTRIDEIEWTMK
jgi:DNA modification methylase